MITLFIRCRAVIILISFNGLHKEMMTGTDDLNRCQMICNSLGFNKLYCQHTVSFARAGRVFN